MTHRSIILVVAVAALPSGALAQAQRGYQQPPAPIAAMLDAEPLPIVQLSPDGETLLLVRREAMPSISEVGAPFLGLAGARINPRTNGGWTDASYLGLTLRSVQGGRERAVRLPAGMRVGAATWAPDGRNIAFTARTDTSIHLWVADVATGAARPILPARLNAATGAMPCAWSSASSLLCRTIPSNRGAAPQAAEIPDGPVIQENDGETTANATFQDLLRNAHDERLFEHYFTTQLVHVALGGATRAVGAAGLHMAATPSPDGRYLLVATTHPPYSYQVPRSRFPMRTEIWTSDGRVVRTLADVNVQDNLARAFDAVPSGLRSASWRADAPATVVWAEALDRGDPSVDVPKRDAVRMLAAPFEGDPATLAQLDYRYRGVTWGDDRLAVLHEGWNRTRRTRSWAVDPSTPGRGARVLFDRSSEDAYGNPGSFETRANAWGHDVLVMTDDRRYGYLTGTGASPEGDRPFLDRYEFATGATVRLFRSEAPYYESLVALLDADGRRMVTRRESINEAPNYFVRDLEAKTITGLTAFEDPAPQFAGVTRELITYTRADGVQLSATLYLPPNYDKSRDGALPFLLWAYPREFLTASAAAQVSGSPYRFTRPAGSSHLYALTQGYGVLDGPTMPIIADSGGEPNDRYIPQLVASAQAAVDEIVRRGVADRDRVGVGGHSYGAFMTANLLSHSNIFKAGIARSGAYNRTLTPFGFQAEQRNYWEAQEIYTSMSPFTYAHQVTAPTLLIHGAADDNQGTFPVQSERYFAALKGNGKTARLVMLPAEAHGYRARESNGHVLHEMVQWLDRYVKRVPPRA